MCCAVLCCGVVVPNLIICVLCAVCCVLCCVIKYGVISSLVVRLMVYSQPATASLEFVSWSLLIQTVPRFVMDLVCCLVEAHQGHALWAVWRERKWGFCLFAAYFLLASGLWLYVLVFNIMTPAGVRPLKYGIGWE
jgi:hypothetical protein